MTSSATTTTHPELAAKAFSYLRAGLSLIPVSAADKRPIESLLPHDSRIGLNGRWEPFQTRLATEAELRYWLDHDAQIAVVCGAISGNLLVIDFDELRFYTAWTHAVGALAAGLVVIKTGRPNGGRQVWLRCPNPGSATQLAWMPDAANVAGRKVAIETRGDGGYAVAAPSLHPSGNYYDVVSGDLLAIPTISQAHVDALLDAARKLCEAPYTKQQLENMAIAMQKASPYRQTLNGSGSIIDEYNRAVNIEQGLQQAGYRQSGDRYIRPGGSNRSVVVRDVDGKRKSFHNSSNDPLCDGRWHDAFDLFCFYEHNGDAHAAARAAATLLCIPLPSHTPQTPSAPPASQQAQPGQQQNPVLPVPSNKNDLVDAARVWQIQYGQDWRYDQETLTWRQWVGTHWEYRSQHSPILVKQAAKVLRETGLSVSSLNRIHGAIALAATECLCDFSQPHGLVNFRNGTLDTKINILRAHDRDDLLTYCLPYDYAPGAYPVIQKYLDETMPDPAAPFAYMTHLGLALLGDTRFHKAVLLLGPKRSGKSTALRLANAVCGNSPDIGAGSELFDRQSEGMRSRATWNGRRIVTIEELPKEALHSEELIKNMTAHGGVAQRQLFAKEPTENQWRSKLLMATNDEPRYSDRSGALTDRFLFISCPNGRQSERSLNRFLFDSMVPELSAFAPACIELALQALANGAYPESSDMERLKTNIENAGDTVKLFVAECCVFDAESWLSTAELYNAYIDFCDDQGTQDKYRMAKARFTAAIRERYPRKVELAERRDGAGKKCRGLLGLRLKTDRDEIEPEPVPVKPEPSSVPDSLPYVAGFRYRAIYAGHESDSEAIVTGLYSDEFYATELGSGIEIARTRLVEVLGTLPDQPVSEPDVAYDQRRTAEAKAFVASGKFDKARQVADTLRGRQDRMSLHAWIDQQEVQAGQSQAPP